ncbi:MAG TPA: molybdenum cofactor guanylyltransferase [Candidatus Dormibacteraeota bacterium]
MTSPPPADATGAGLGLLILAGGRSSRMGRDKPGLAFPEAGDPPLIWWTGSRLAAIAGPPTVAGPTDYGTGWPVVEDDPEIDGPVGGLVAGLAASPHPLLLVVGGDVPFPCPRLAQGLALIAEADPGLQAVVPERQGRLEPLFAVYRRDGLVDLRQSARQLMGPGRGPSLRRTLEALRLRRVPEPEWRPWDPAGDSFLSCNTPGELAAAAARAKVPTDQGGVG